MHIRSFARVSILEHHVLSGTIYPVKCVLAYLQRACPFESKPARLLVLKLSRKHRSISIRSDESLRFQQTALSPK